MTGVPGNRGRIFHCSSDESGLSPRDPELAALLRQALTTNGINPNGIYIRKIFAKEWVLGISYKVTYVNADGFTCHFHFRYNRIWGLDVAEMPQCDRREIGLPPGGGGGGGGCDKCEEGGYGSGSGLEVFKGKIKITTSRDLKAHAKHQARNINQYTDQSIK